MFSLKKIVREWLVNGYYNAYRKKNIVSTSPVLLNCMYLHLRTCITFISLLTNN